MSELKYQGKYRGSNKQINNPGQHRKLTKQDIEDIVYLYCTKGVSQKDIAKYYNVSTRTIRYILNADSRTENYKRALSVSKTAERRERDRARYAQQKELINNDKHSKD